MLTLARVSDICCLCPRGATPSAGRTSANVVVSCGAQSRRLCCLPICVGWQDVLATSTAARTMPGPCFFRIWYILTRSSGECPKECPPPMAVGGGRGMGVRPGPWCIDTVWEFEPHPVFWFRSNSCKGWRPKPRTRKQGRLYHERGHAVHRR